MAILPTTSNINTAYIFPMSFVAECAEKMRKQNTKSVTSILEHSSLDLLLINKVFERLAIGITDRNKLVADLNFSFVYNINRGKRYDE